MTKARWLIIIIPLLILALALAGGYTVLWRFFVLLVTVILLAWLWTALSARGIKGSVIEGPAYYRVGEEIRLEFSISNTGRIPAPLIEVREDTDLPGYWNTTTINLPAGRTHRWRSSAFCRQRGRYYLGKFTARVTDPMGFFPLERRFGKRQDIIVFPATVELPFFQPVFQQGPGASRRRWFAGEAGPDASRVREYISGDSLRHIHWQTTAHTGKLMVKEFDPDRSNYAFDNVWIILDMQEKGGFGQGLESTGEYGVTVAASLVKKYIDSGKNVGMIASGDRSYLFLPGTGEDQAQRIMAALAVVKQTGKIPLESLLSLESDTFEEGTAIIIIMPSCDQKIIPSLHRAVNRGVIVTVVLLDSQTFGGGPPAAAMARNLTSAGFNVYIIERGARIAQALDFRLPQVKV